MRHRIFVDTNVLFPFSVMDLFLALTEDAVHQVVWTEELLDEWERVIVRERRRAPEVAESVTSAVRRFFADCRIDRASYEQLIEHMPGSDPDDRPHMAAAVAAKVGAIITWNTGDFPAAPLAARGVRVMDPDEYLAELLADLPHEVVSTIVRLAAEKTRPPITPDEFLDSLRAAGLQAFAEQARNLL